MRQRPILFSKPMVFAIMDDIKTQTRRTQGLETININPDARVGAVNTHENVWDFLMHDGGIQRGVKCPYGKPGDQLWVKETVWVDADTKEFKWYAHQRIFNVDRVRDNARLWPSIHMRRAWSRIQLEITGIRVERLQDISDADALAEGVISYSVGNLMVFGVDGTKIEALSPRAAYFALWDEINGRGSADANPWVWVVEFKRIG